MLTEGKHEHHRFSEKWVVISDPSQEEKDRLFTLYGLPQMFFDLNEEKTMASMQSCYTPLNKEGFVLHMPLWHEGDFSGLQAASSTLTSYVAPHVTVICIDTNKHNEAVGKTERAVTALDYIYEEIMNEYTRLSSILDELKMRIIEVENQTKAKANRHVLLQLTDLEQEVVIASSRLDDYEESLSRFLNHVFVATSLSMNRREDIRLAVKKAHYRIHLYRDLVESTSGLLSDSIDNKLNTIMEYLQTWALVISIPTLIFSLFGINTSGMIGRETPFGSWLVIAVALLLGAVTAFWLKKKEFK